MSVEEDLRATFARHESETPAVGPVQDKIKAAFVRRKRRRAITATAVAVLAVAVAFPMALNGLRPSPASVTALAEVAPSAAAQTGLNVLLIATDKGLTRAEPTAVAVSVVHLTADLSRAYLVSLPRTGVVAGVSLADSFARGGKAATGRQVSELTGLNIDVTATVEPAVLRVAVDEAGGFDVCKTKTNCRRQSGAEAVRMLRTHLAAGGSGVAAENFLQMLAVRMAPIRDMAGLERILQAATRVGGRDAETLAALLTAVRSLPGATTMSAPEFVVVRSPEPAARTIYPQVGPSLYAAIRADDLAAWTVDHPDYAVTR